MKKAAFLLLLLLALQGQGFADELIAIPKKFNIKIKQGRNPTVRFYYDGDPKLTCESGQHEVTVVGIVKDPQTVCMDDIALTGADIIGYVAEAINDAGGFTSDSSLAHGYLGFKEDGKFKKVSFSLERGTVSLPLLDKIKPHTYINREHPFIFVNRNYLSFGQKAIDFLGTVISAGLPFASGLIIGNSTK